MRIRKKHWARPNLEACDFFIENPMEMMGRWHGAFSKAQKIWLELGCGKGGFISQIGARNPDVNFIAVDIKDEMLVLAKQKIERAYADKNIPLNNVRLTAFEIMCIQKVFNHEDEIDRIYINFCNPWFKNRHKARRLTHPNQLNQYKIFLKNQGQIWFKTDNEPLFLDSLQYFQKSGFKITYMTEDLIKSDFMENIVTEHEKMFSEEGIPIKFLIAEIQ